MKTKINIKGCGRMLAISSDRDCGAYCPFCEEIHYCVFCGGGYKLHKIALKKMAEDMKLKNKKNRK